MGGQRHALADLYPGKKPGMHCTRGWVSPSSCLGGREKSRPSPGFYLWTFHSEASRYTSYAVLALT